MHKFISILAFCICFLFSLHASANETIKKIDVQGLQRISYETVLSYAEIETDTEYSNSISNEIIKKLYDTQLFSDVSVSYLNQIITITVKENPTINLVLFEGNKSKKDEDLISEIKLVERSVFSRSKIKEDVKRLLELYQR